MEACEQGNELGLNEPRQQLDRLLFNVRATSLEVARIERSKDDAILFSLNRHLDQNKTLVGREERREACC